MEQHVKIVSILNIINGFIAILGGVICFLALAGIGWMTNDAVATTILKVVGFIIGSIFILIGLPGVIGGFQLLKQKESGRILTLISGFINLVNFPIGTALGVYTIWVLFHDDIGSVIPNAKSAPVKL